MRQFGAFLQFLAHMVHSGREGGGFPPWTTSPPPLDPLPPSPLRSSNPLGEGGVLVHFLEQVIGVTDATLRWGRDVGTVRDFPEMVFKDTFVRPLNMF